MMNSNAEREPLTRFQAAPALLPSPAVAPPGLGVMVAVACGFGNCFTLPLLYLSTLHPAETALATAFLALFWMSWDPLFWTVGYRTLLKIGYRNPEAAQKADTASPGLSAIWKNAVEEQGDLAAVQPSASTQSSVAASNTQESSAWRNSGPVIDADADIEDEQPLSPLLKGVQRTVQAAAVRIWIGESASQEFLGL